MSTFPDDYNIIQPITIDNSNISSALTNFQFLVTRDHLDNTALDPSGANNAQVDGGDIRFSSDVDGLNQLACHVINFEHDSVTDAADASIFIRVLVPSVSDVADTVIYAWYNTAASDSQPLVSDSFGRNAVYADCVAAWGMESDPSVSAPQIIDYTGNGHNGTSVGTMLTGDLVAGKISNAIDFDGIDDEISVPDSDAFTLMSANNDEFTVMGWVYPRSNASSKLISKPNEWAIELIAGASNPKFRIAFYGSNSGETASEYAQNAWHHYAATYVAGTGGDIYVNGSNDKIYSNTNLSANNASDLYIASEGASNYTNAIIDETKIFAAILSADYVTATHINENLAATFASAGTPVDLSGSAGGFGSNFPIQLTTGLVDGGLTKGLVR